jgi:hypothetical protein
MITRSARLCVGELCNYYVVQSTVVQSERSAVDLVGFAGTSEGLKTWWEQSFKIH